MGSVSFVILLPDRAHKYVRQSEKQTNLIRTKLLIFNWRYLYELLPPYLKLPFGYEYNCIQYVGMLVYEGINYLAMSTVQDKYTKYSFLLSYR